MNNRLYSIIFYLISGISLIFFSVFIFRSEPAELIYHIPDDASYYLKIADNFNKGLGTTFDGINKTNGFQPMWQYAVILISGFTNHSNEFILRTVLFIQILLLALSSFFFFKTVSNKFGNKAALGSGIIFLLFVFPLCINGMESSLMVLILILLLGEISRSGYIDTFNFRTDMKISLLTGMLILSRLDMIFFAFSILIFFLLNSSLKINSREMYFKKIITLLTGLAVCLLPYLIYNLYSFGNILPVSGYLKTGIQDVSMTEKIKELSGYRETFFALASVAYFILYLIFLKKIKTGSDFAFFSMLAIFSLSNIFLLIFLFFFIDWFVFYWYFIPFPVFVSFFMSIPFYYFLRKQKSNTGKIIYFILLLMILLYWGRKNILNYSLTSGDVKNNWNIESYKASQWVKNNSDVNDVYAMKDAGHFGFFSERKVINLDGLVNSFEFQEVLRNKKLNEYLKSNNAGFIVQHAVWGREDVTDGNYDSLNLNYISHKYSENSDPVIVYKKNEIYRSLPYFDGNNRVSFIIWRLNK